MVYREECVFRKFLCIWDFKARWIENAFSHCHQKFINNSLCKTKNFTDKVKAFFFSIFPKSNCCVYLYRFVCNLLDFSKYFYKCLHKVIF